MFKFFRSFFSHLPTYSPFNTYYTSVVRKGAEGAPTADEARRDLELRRDLFLHIGGL